MDANRDPVVATLAELTCTELHALIDATYNAPQTAPGLLASIDAAFEVDPGALASSVLGTAPSRRKHRIQASDRSDMRVYTFRRLAVFIRWLSIGWIAVAYLLPPLLPGGVANWDDFFDDAFLVGAVPGTLGLLLSYVLDKAASKADQTETEGSR